MTSALEQYQAVNGAWTEGRLENVLQRQKELALLHANLKKFSPDLIRAISHDVSAADELQLSLDSIKQLYGDLDFPDTLAKEKLVRKGASSLNNFVPVGPSLIDPSPYSPLASVITPLAAALAAGSPAIVLASPATPTVNAELRKLIIKSVDVEAFAITDDDDSTSTRRDLSTKFFGVAALQNLAHRDTLFPSLYKVNPLIRTTSTPCGTPAVFVDRSAEDLEAVASHLINATLRAPRHNPLRTPRLVFVDEINLEQLDKLVRADSSANDPLSFGNDEETAQAVKKIFQLVSQASNTKPVIQSSGHLPAVITLDNAESIVEENIQKAVELLVVSTNGLLLVPTRSLDHGIDILSKLNAETPSQAVYIFASSKASTYVALFTNSVQVFINTIPRWSLAVIAPSTSFVKDRLLYSREDFSVSKPILQESVKSMGSLAAGANSVWPFLSQSVNLVRIKQPKGGRLSYFERGLLVGLALSLIAISGTGFWIHRGIQRFIIRS
ncbi:hypothetical protein FHETE_3871 [Fusarium heterosporum]|uniref:Aldehyde dehydrogenase domain-containing protein n=1 Tax=Fusarium heterosporum TaxID=42747 RepID=A0A8H5TMX9_FUSHE|nr:hypothetical protein FHETE_3871 [Fusarium heterosporum]